MARSLNSGKNIQVPGYRWKLGTGLSETLALLASMIFGGLLTPLTTLLPIPYLTWAGITSG